MNTDEPLRDEVVLIDKPLGLTSHDVVARVRRASGERRVGHAGTLDPLASGLLIVLIGRGATRRQVEFMGQPKIYQAELTFGSISETEDAEGPILPQATLEELQALTEADILKVLENFIGTIEQRPPAHSAIKVDGQPLYKKARKGLLIAEDIPTRTVTIDSITLDQFVPTTPPFPPTARITVHCQKGTYIRSLARDIGAALGVGGYLSELRRTAIGDFKVT
ncbi:MAG: tRNA pseudouridine(55) synthase TruB, partial [Candidatus Kerfeldbacteria bacterium CG_4_9_14_3_um_filter_45_8]